MTKEINIEWMNEVLNERNTGDFSGNGPAIDWVQNRKGFKRNLKFKLIRPNSKENKIFSHIVYTHWIDNDNGGPNHRMVCPEQTPHLKKLGAKCPVCEAKRKLLSMGFKEEDLCKQGKFGPIPVFDANITSNVKVVVLDSDVKHDWDKEHVSVLQQKGTGLTRWLLEQYKNNETPDFMEWERSNVIEFSRDSDNGRWERSLTFGVYEPTPDVIDRLKEENEAITMPDLWKMPSDEDFIQMKGIMDDIVNNYVAAREAIKNSSTTTLEANNIYNQQPVYNNMIQQSQAYNPNNNYKAQAASLVTDDDIPF